MPNQGESFQKNGSDRNRPERELPQWGEETGAMPLKLESHQRKRNCLRTPASKSFEGSAMFINFSRAATLPAV